MATSNKTVKSIKGLWILILIQHIYDLSSKRALPSLFANKTLVIGSSQQPHISPYTTVSHFPLPPSCMNTYISALGERHSVKIKGLDDKGRHEERWICNKFIAVVKILKVSKKSALTRCGRKKKKMLESLLIGKNAQRRRRGWALVYLPGWDKSISCLSEWASCVCSTTKALWTKAFFKVWVSGTVSFVIRVQLLNACFISPLPSVLAIWTSLAVF